MDFLFLAKGPAVKEVFSMLMYKTGLGKSPEKIGGLQHLQETHAMGYHKPS